MPISSKRFQIRLFTGAWVSMFLAVLTMFFQIKFILIPTVVFLVGLGTYFFHSEKALKWFLFFMPILGALPFFASNGYAYNLLAVPLFYVFGLVVASILKKEDLPFSGNWLFYYKIFLVLTWISVIFLFLRWSNLFFSSDTFLKDTLVSPQGTRVSFAIIYPVVTLLIFSVSPYLFGLLKKNHLNPRVIFNWLLSGFTLSVGIAFLQKLIVPGFMRFPIPSAWGENPAQFNGGFSDFNGFGFFSGAMFLHFFIRATGKPDNYKNRLIAMAGIIVSGAGIMLSGSRSSVLFVLAALLYLFTSRNVTKKIKTGVIIILAVGVFFAGGTLKTRLAGSFDTLFSGLDSKTIFSGLEKFSNGRIGMIRNSIPMISEFPLSGVGEGNFLFTLQTLKYGEDYYEDLSLNQYLEVLTEVGFVGLLLFVAFLWSVLSCVDRKEGLFVFITFLAGIFFNNYFGFPEIVLLFWIFLAVYERPKWKSRDLRQSVKYTVYILIAVFVASNIWSFDSLSPYRQITKKGVKYQYGFYQEKEYNNFLWTAGEAGIYINLDENGESEGIELFCGAPLESLPGRKQAVFIKWRGKPYQTVVFQENKSVMLGIKGIPGEKGILKFYVRPLFNLRDLGLGEDARDLGVQIHSPFKKIVSADPSED